MAVRQCHRRGDRREPKLARSPLYRAGDRPLHPEPPLLSGADAALDRRRRHLLRQSQAAPARAGLEQSQPALSGEHGRARRAARTGRLRDVHASACRPCRLEHAADQRALGADLSEGALSDGARRIPALGGRAPGNSAHTGQSRRVRGFGAACRRGRPGRRQQMPRTTSSTATPACALRRRRATPPATCRFISTAAAIMP